MKYFLGNVAATAVLVLLGYFLYLTLSQSTTSVQTRGTIRVGCEPFYPYQFEDPDTGNMVGMDVEVLREAFRRAGYQVELVDGDWSKLVGEVHDGKLQAAALAFYNRERSEFANFSRPYYYLRSAIFYRLDQHVRLPGDPVALRQLILGEGLRLGTSRGYAYPDELTALLQDPSLRRVEAKNDADSLGNLMDGEVDVVLGDELSGTSLLMRNRWGGRVACQVLEVPIRPVHVMFSKKSGASQALPAFNKALEEMEISGDLAATARAYQYPLLLNLLARHFFFDYLSLLATGAAAISGIFMARKEGYNPVGAFLLAAAPAAGGGLVRDLISGRHPVAVVADPTMLATVLWLVVAGYLLFRIIARLPARYGEALERMDVDHHPLLVAFDTLGLACFTVIGVMVALQTHCEPLWMWGPLLAATTNGGGSLLRDVIRHRPHTSLRTTTLYLEISILWGLMLSGFLIYYSAHPPYQVIVLQGSLALTMVGVMVTRALALRFELRSPDY